MVTVSIVDGVFDSMHVRPGADIEAKSSFWCQTPLMWAAESGHLQIVQLLVRYGECSVPNPGNSSNCSLHFDHSVSVFME